MVQQAVLGREKRCLKAERQYGSQFRGVSDQISKETELGLAMAPAESACVVEGNTAGRMN